MSDNARWFVSSYHTACTDTVSNVTASLSCELMVVPGQCGTLGQPVLTARLQSDCCSTFSASIRWISQKSRPSIPLPSPYWSSASVITWPSTNLQSSSGECCATDSVDIPRTLACNALKHDRCSPEMPTLSEVSPC